MINQLYIISRWRETTFRPATCPEAQRGISRYWALSRRSFVTLFLRIRLWRFSRQRLVTDGLSSYQTCVGNRVGISHGGCWAHARRKFADAVKGKKNNTGVAKDAILLIKELFEIEKSIKGKGADVIQAARTEKSEPVIKAIESLWTSRIGLIPRKSLSGKALHYLKNQWELLTRFLKDPNLPIHNNFVERQVRPLAVGRRAWLFCDTPAGAQASATFYSLLVTAKENGLDPMDYLIRVFSEIDQCDDLTLLLPFA